MDTRTENRWRAFDAIRAWHPRWQMEAVLRDAATIQEFVEQQPGYLVLRVGLVRKQASGTTVAPQPEGTPMQLRDDEEVTYTLQARDAKGYTIAGETFSCVSSDETVVTVTQVAAEFTAVAGQPGSATLTFSDGTVTATEAIDVVPGDVATVDIAPGDVTKQAATT